ncbi:MAG TPA: hypothetical protein VHQ22_12350 [Terriglobales bacterium]|jgi:hypothetical protein|nr:hypothetical protein [Terriglobales bacterium]
MKKKDSAKRTVPGKTRSRLYDQSNGFLLGCFLALIRFEFARDEYPLHRSRIHEFFDEAGINVRLPPSRVAYNRSADALQLKVAKACHKKSAQLRDFMLIGAFSALDALLRALGRSASDELRAASITALKRNKLKGKALYDRYLARVAQLTADSSVAPDSVKMENILTPGMEMLVSALEPLKRDDAMCFVAMPFSPPYSGYFSSFYRPLANHLDCGAFRMWGGLSGEAYVDLMLTIIRRCKFVIADVSSANVNVLYEVGVARGLEKRVIPLCQKTHMKKLPSNITSDQLFQVYSPHEKDWPNGVILRCATQVALVDFAVQLAEEQLVKARWVGGQALPQLLE